jgi:tetraacyldisaccharide 4'-kinase
VKRRSASAGGLEAGLARIWWQPRRSAAAQALRPLSWCYAIVTALRRWGFARGWLSSFDAPVPTLVVGNLVVGGAGKTPTTLALVHALRAAGMKPGVISRGHGRSTGGVEQVQPRSAVQAVGDEALLIHLRAAVPVFVARRRIDAARALCAAHAEVNVLIADVGQQHLALRRDAQLIVIDDRGVGNGLLLPAGPLRQRLPKHLPPRTQLLYNAEQPSTALPGSLATRRLAGAVALQDWWEGAPASAAQLQALRQRPLLAAAGIAAPQRFFAMLRAAGLRFDELPLADHHGFESLPWARGTPDVLVTEKDAVKLRPERCDGTRVWVVALDFLLPETLIDAVLADLGHARSRPGPQMKDKR